MILTTNATGGATLTLEGGATIDTRGLWVNAQIDPISVSGLGLLDGGKTICGVLRPHELSFLFGEDGPSVGSAAVVSLDDQLGVLAIGSRDPQHYKSSLGTLFLGYIAEVLARVLPRFGTPLRSVR